MGGELTRSNEMGPQATYLVPLPRNPLDTIPEVPLEKKLCQPKVDNEKWYQMGEFWVARVWNC